MGSSKKQNKGGKRNLKQKRSGLLVGSVVAAVAALALALVVFVVANDNGDEASTATAVQRVSAEVALEKASEPGVRVVDVRTQSEYAGGHLPGAVNIDVEASTFASGIAALDKNTTYVVYCRSGNRSRTATNLMRDAGFTKLYDVDGGINDLKAAGAKLAV